MVEQDRVFIPSKLRDNKFLGPEYVANLQMVGNDSLVRAWLEGDWTVIEGAYFECWRYEQHVVEPFEVPAHWARFRSMDWGSAKPFSVGWWAIVSDDYYVPRAEGGPDAAAPSVLDPSNSTSPRDSRPLHCEISTRLMSAPGLGRVKTQACVASVENLEGIAHGESQILLRIRWLDT